MLLHLRVGLAPEPWHCVAAKRCIPPPAPRPLPQANVYHGTAPGRGEVAIKIYKTSILVFKDRYAWSPCMQWRRQARSTRVGVLLCAASDT